MTIAIQASNITKHFPVGEDRITVLHGINLDIKLGELTMLTGPSGCGKTTLISILSGILSPSSGDIKVTGHLINSMDDNQKVLFRRNNIGFIFQQYNLLPALSAAENAAMPLFAAGVAEEEALEKSRAILDQIGLAGHTEKKPKQLSGGQQQRVAIARSLVHNPRVIVCDEPTAALDAKSGQSIMEILRNVANDKSRAVIVVTHDNRIYHFADRTLTMSDGRIIDDTSNKNISKKTRKLDE